MNDNISMLEEIGFTSEDASSISRALTQRAINDLICNAKTCEAHIKKAVGFYNDYYLECLNAMDNPYGLYDMATVWESILSELTVARGFLNTYEKMWRDELSYRTCIKGKYKNANWMHLYHKVFWPIIYDYFNAVKLSLDETIDRANERIAFACKHKLNRLYGHESLNAKAPGKRIENKSIIVIANATADAEDVLDHMCDISEAIENAIDILVAASSGIAKHR